ncbi:MAG: hypothetical protein C0511_06490 [Hyphomicrobium sp.]|nr:hypothetical protein [Hyphomicrobium sp.]
MGTRHDRYRRRVRSVSPRKALRKRAGHECHCARRLGICRHRLSRARHRRRAHLSRGGGRRACRPRLGPGARQLKDANLGDRIVVWGHSQGGNSALWTGMRAIEFAPELQVIGVAALAPASDLKGLVQASKSGMFGKIVSSYVIAAYAQAYGDVKVEDYVGLLSRVIAGDMAKRCVAGYQTLFSVLETTLLPAEGIFRKDPTSGPLGSRLAENTPTNIVPSPLLIAQGEIDDLVLPEVQKRYVTARCSAGQRIDFRTYPGRDHVSVVAPDSPLAPELVQWTRDRFEGKPAKNTCR